MAATPIGWQGGGNTYRGVAFFAYGDYKWQEKYWAIVTGSSAPVRGLSTGMAAISTIRLSVLNSDASCFQVRSSYISEDPLNPIKLSYLGEAASDGCGTGGQDPPFAPPWTCWNYAFWDPTLTIHERKPFRGLPQAFNTWQPGGAVIVSPLFEAAIDNITTTLQGFSPAASAGNGQVRFCIRSNSLTVGSPPALQLIATSVGMNGVGQLNFTVASASNPGPPLQWGWTGAGTNPNISPTTVRPVQSGDHILVHGGRVNCLKGISGQYQVIGVKTVTQPFPGIQYQTSKFVCCSATQLALFSGTIRVLQYAYFPISVNNPIGIGDRDTGGSAGQPRGKAKNSCCNT